jgi:hypothetical protein
VIPKILRSCGAAVFALLLASGAIFFYGETSSAGSPTQAPRPEHVILISVDGMPPDPRMRASLIIYGAGARSGAKLPLARMIDLAPSIAVLLN